MIKKKERNTSSEVKRACWAELYQVRWGLDTRERYRRLQNYGKDKKGGVVAYS